MARVSLPFDQQCRMAGLPVPTPEYLFARSMKRRWRFDWAFVEQQVAVEVEGGAFMVGGGRHTRGAGFVRDLEKYNHATILGWRVLRVTPQQITNWKALTYVERLLGEKR